MSGRPGSVQAGAARAAILWLVRLLARQARLKWLVRTALDRFPALQTRLYGLIRNDTPPRRVHAPQDIRDLSPATQAAYRDLERYFEAKKH